MNPLFELRVSGFLPDFRDLGGDPHFGECPPATRSRRFARFGVVAGETAICVSGLRPPAGSGNKIEKIQEESGRKPAPKPYE